MKKNTIRVDDIWNEKVPLKNIHVVEDTIIDIDDKLKKCEEALERAELGIGYDESLLKKFGDAIEDRNTVYDFTWQLTTWIHDNIDAPFKNDFDTYAWSPLSDIDYRKYEIDNDIGVTTKNSHPNAQGIIIEKKKLNLKDFLGSENEDKKSDSKNCEQVDDFAKIFIEQYKNLSKTMSEGDEKVKLPDMRKFWDPESKTTDERFKEFLSMVADATIIVPIADAILGKDIITGEKLSTYGVTSKILIAVIDVITLGVGSLSNPAVSGVIKEYALGLTAATVSAAVYEAADASGLPPAVINALTIGAGIVTVIIGNKVLFKNKAGKVLATKDLDELKNPRARGNEAPPLRRELDDYLDGVGEFYEDDVFGQYYEPWPEMDDYLDELARHSREVDVGSVSKSGLNSVDDIIKGVENGDIPLSNNIQKGNYGEMKMDAYFESQGYERISLDRVTDLNTPTHQGIDGVYYNPDGHPPYIIGEAKYGSSKLGSTLDGKQMSDNWVDKRLVDAVGEEMADDIVLEMMINPDNVQKQLVNISTDGNIIMKILDEYANVVK